MTLTKDRIIELMKSKSQISGGDAKNLVETMIESIKNKLENGEEVKISSFGKWIVNEKKTRMGRNPHTGQKMEILARKVVTFNPSQKMKDAVNNAQLSESQYEEVNQDVSA